jgi:rod shape determining protein RodA
MYKKKMQRYIIIYIISIAFVFSVNLMYEHLLEPHQKVRVATILGQTSDPKGADFNLNQSKIAIGSGGFFGKGYLKGTQTKLKFVPEQSTDFIFCAIGEEWGFMGTLVVFGLYLALIYRILSLSEKSRIPFVRYYGYGIAGIIAVHFFVNIGMTIGLVPIIGIPLPFLSYGGSSLWAFTTMLFIFIKLNDN